MGFSGQEYCCGLPLPLPGNLPDPGIDPGSPALQGDSLPSEPQEAPRKPILRDIEKFQKGHVANNEDKIPIQVQTAVPRFFNMMLYSQVSKPVKAAALSPPSHLSPGRGTQWPGVSHVPSLNQPLGLGAPTWVPCSSVSLRWDHSHLNDITWPVAVAYFHTEGLRTGR